MGTIAGRKRRGVRKVFRFEIAGYLSQEIKCKCKVYEVGRTVSAGK